MGVDQILDMARTATNVLGNGIATAVVSRWEGAPVVNGESRLKAVATP
jgi:Na+/H+-dicarboxylate symporter